MTTFIMEGVTVYEETEVIKNGYVLVKDGIIDRVGWMKDLADLAEESYPRYNFSSQPNFSLVPGFIDIHIHGAGGADMMDSTPDALRKMTSILPQEGITSLLATTITQEEKEISNSLANVVKFMKSQPRLGEAEILGVHLEGPFISPKKAGAQPVSHIQHPSQKLFERWQTIADGNIKVVTMAPEEQGGLEFIKHAVSQGVVVSIGHSDATFETVEQAVTLGASHVTHLYNQMRGLHHREPGVVGAALSINDIYVEIICDGIHVHPQVVKATYNAKGSEKMILITDSMRAKWLEDGNYDLGGQEVTVTSNTALLKDGTLAGSVLKMDEALRNFLDFTGASLLEGIKVASENPAKRLGVFNRKGSIRVGKDADFIILDNKNEVTMTFCRGELSYQKGGH
ncbi:N-acetylglucosamine-6-phosphate deacetylase [Sutcliffiella deserti]|uniref:N-acetylglucosamine-6-phosphate deacetylase n=1 Tax=Sutcliffiella deserti TaxID=2875501 RepID=UPI001CBA7B66|nr:N-acetylglucosamine-6-phosphate deacetylase [Sutcliffiella deserti]